MSSSKLLLGVLASVQTEMKEQPLVFEKIFAAINKTGRNIDLSCCNWTDVDDQSFVNAVTQGAAVLGFKDGAISIDYVLISECKEEFRFLFAYENWQAYELVCLANAILPLGAILGLLAFHCGNEEALNIFRQTLRGGTA